jgi:DNA-binding MarR family transcriptional regulator/GNAT superfamily N-acetyltransferase
MPAPAGRDRVDAVRRFNRFYTQHIGVLNEGLLDSPLSLAQGRVLYEIAHRDRPAASEIGDALGLDPGYLSRILRDFDRRGLVTTARADGDRRRRLLALTAAGRRMIATLDARARKQVASFLDPRSSADQARLLGAMETIHGLLAPAGSTGNPGAEAPGPRARRDSRGTESPAPRRQEAWTLRPHRPGDMGWIVHRQGVLYTQEYGWDEHFEAMVARITADFIDRFDPARERCWIAERHGVIVGSVFVVRHTKTTAKLRLLYVEPDARGLGIGKRLVDECVNFAREAGYRRMTLWTNSILDAARHLYERAGFERVGRERLHRFGRDLEFETWALDLRP